MKITVSSLLSNTNFIKKILFGGGGGHSPSPKPPPVYMEEPGGPREPCPPDFKIYASAPQISTPNINQHWLEIILRHVFSCVTFVRSFCYRGEVHTCSYMEFQELIHNPSSHFASQVVTCQGRIRVLIIGRGG